MYLCSLEKYKMKKEIKTKVIKVASIVGAGALIVGALIGGAVVYEPSLPIIPCENNTVIEYVDVPVDVIVEVPVNVTEYVEVPVVVTEYVDREVLVEVYQDYVATVVFGDFTVTMVSINGETTATLSEYKCRYSDYADMSGSESWVCSTQVVGDFAEPREHSDISNY